MWLVDLQIVCVSGLVFGMLAGLRGVVSILGVRVGMRELYTPVLVLTVLAALRIMLSVRPRVELSARLQPWVVKLALVAVLACAGPLSPVIFGLGQRMADGRLKSPPIFWRSSPRGVDLLGFLSPNPNNPVVRALRR